MKILLRSMLFFALAISLVSCDKDDDKKQLQLSFDNLTNLGEGYAYEGWIMVDGSPKSAGIFTVDDEGNLSQNSFEIDANDLESASAYILTIEPSPDSDPAPSSTHILAGEFGDDKANLTIAHQAALGSDFKSAQGGFVLATPSDGMNTNETSGVWFLDPTSGSMKPSLVLPTLPKGWIYEGWAVIDGQPVSTGTFDSVEGADNHAPYSGDQVTPPFPGEDFLRNAPVGITFPTDLTRGAIVVSVEPVPDNSPAPYGLKPLFRKFEGSESEHNYTTMNNNAKASSPKGSVKKVR